MKLTVLPKRLSPTLEHLTRYIYPHCSHCKMFQDRLLGHDHACGYDGCQLSYIRRHKA